MSKATIHPCPHTSLFCDTFNCKNRVKYYIGNPEGPNIGMKVCEECARSIVENLPDELVKTKRGRSTNEKSKGGE